MKIRVNKEFDTIDGTVPEGEYEVTNTTWYGTARNSKPEPAYTVKGCLVTKSNFDYYVDRGDVEIIQEEIMSNLPAVVKQECDVFAIMDKMDDDIIQAELENRVVSTWVYSFQGQEGKQQTGLSKKGVDEACTEMAKQGHLIEEEDLQWSKCPLSDEYVVFKAKVRRVVLGKDGARVPMEPVFGTKRQWIKDHRKNGPDVDDKFWFEKGAAKALRNARSRLIPAEIQAKIIALAKTQGKVKEVGPKNTPPPSAPPKPEFKGGTKKQIGELEELYKGTYGKMDINHFAWVITKHRKGTKLSFDEAKDLIDNWQTRLDQLDASESEREAANA